MIGIQVNVTTVNVATRAGLDFNNQLNFNGNTLIRQGSGTLSLNNAMVGVGSVDCQDGVCNGAGTVSGLINIATTRTRQSDVAVRCYRDNVILLS